jgi:hypothetical protein
MIFLKYFKQDRRSNIINKASFLASAIDYPWSFAATVDGC